MKKINEVKFGIVLSYLLIIAQTIYGLFMTPYIIQSLGVDEYGVYKTITAITSSLMVIDLGLGGTVTRYVASYVADKKEKEIPNFMAMNVIQGLLLTGILFMISTVIYQFINPVYGDTFTNEQLKTAKTIFIILTITVAVHIIENVFNGLIKGYNHFVFGNGIMVIRLIVRIMMVFFILSFWGNSVALVLIDLFTTVLFFIIELIYVKIRLQITVRLSHWDKSLFLEAGKYSILMFLTSIITQVESNLDNVVIGAFSGPGFVTIYSVGLTIFGMYLSLSSSVSAVMLPTVTNVLREDDWKNKVQRIIVKVGRFQYLLLGAVVIGFFCIGKDFLLVWMGEGFEDAYLITLLLMIPSLLELSVNVCLSVLRAKNKLGFRTAIVSLTTVLNFLITIILVKNWCYIGAAIGTGISYIIGSIIIMNIYYTKEFGFKMIQIYRKIFHNIWKCQLIAGIGITISSHFMYGTWWAVIANIVVFCVIYAGSLLLFGLNVEEKKSLPIIGRFFKNDYERI